jgi:hypothetical protein
LDHPKFRALCRRLGVEGERYKARGLLGMLWEFTASYAPDGNIGKFDFKYVCEWIGWPQDRSEELLLILTQERLIDQDGPRRLVHDWPDHCEDGTHRYLARRGETFANGKLPKLNKLTAEERLEASRVQTRRSTEVDGPKPDRVAVVNIPPDRILRRYKITRSSYEAMLVRQGGRCAICARVEVLVIDHDHLTGEVRGLLCQGCNTHLGRFEASSEHSPGLERFDMYLRNRKKGGVS